MFTTKKFVYHRKKLITIKKIKNIDIPFCSESDINLKCILLIVQIIVNK